MLIVLSGPSCVGKSFVVDYLCQEYGFLTLTPYTTREPRSSEAEGVQYHFRSERELRQVSANFAHGYWAQPMGDEWYGYSAHVDGLDENPRNWVIQAYSEIALRIKRKHPGTFTVFLDYLTPTEQTARIKERYGKDKARFASRIEHAVHEHGNKDQFDISFELDNPELLAEEVGRFALSKVVQTPTRSSPGPLSDKDLADLIGDPHGIKIEGGTQSVSPKGWSVDLTLSPKFYRVSSRWILGRVFDLSAGDDGDMATRFKERIAKSDKGIFLRANEFILASTTEKLLLPDNIVGIVSGRSSYSRMGISVDFSQNVIQPGHNDTIPLQIRNNLPYPLVVYPGTPLAQIVFFRTVSASLSPYSQTPGARYVGRQDDIRSKFYLDPIYDEIRTLKPRRATDWPRVLNVLLLLSLLSVLASLVHDVLNKRLSYQLTGTIFVVTVLLIVVQAIVVAKERRG
jgi:dCTP deaminase